MDVAIIGSRAFNGPVAKKYLTQVLDQLLPGFFEEIRIISGGAKGADTLAEEYAKEIWDTYAKFLSNKLSK